MTLPQAQFKWRQLASFSLALGAVQGLLAWPLILAGTLGMGQSALAQSGGRTRGGSFDRPAPSQAPSAPSGGGSGGYGGGYSSPSYDYNSPYDSPYSYPRTYRRPPVVVLPPQSYPVPIDTGYGYSTGGDGLFLFLILACGVCILPTLMSYLRANRSGYGVGGRGNERTNELTNDIVTVTQLQVALLSQARSIQDELTQLSLQANLNTAEGLAEFLRETVLALLRAPENWTHARVSAQTVPSREQAAQLFEQLSVQERSKLSAETLVNVGGKVRRQALKVNAESDPAAYIVVTLLVGTADDRPFANAIHSAEELSALLKRLGGVSSDYLMVCEVIWTPQDASDSLSRDQLLASYPDLVQIA